MEEKDKKIKNTNKKTTRKKGVIKKKKDIPKNNSQDKKNRLKEKYILLVVSFFVFVIPLGIFAYMYMSTSARYKILAKNITSKNTLIEDLNNTINTLANRDCNCENACNNGNERAVGTGCILPSDSIYPEFKADVFMGKSDMVFVYENKKISFLIPYNNKWGNADCVIRPYTKTNSGISFGIPYLGGSQFNYSTATKRTSDDIIKELSNNNDFNPEKISINSMEIVTYNVYDELPYKIYEIIGIDNNHIFKTYKKEEDELIKIIYSVRFLKQLDL